MSDMSVTRDGASIATMILQCCETIDRELLHRGHQSASDSAVCTTTFGVEVPITPATAPMLEDAKGNIDLTCGIIDAALETYGDWAEILNRWRAGDLNGSAANITSAASHVLSAGAAAVAALFAGAFAVAV